MCAATVDVAVMGQMMVDISDGSGPECKAHYSACEAMWTALKQKVFTNCEVADTAPGSKLVKTSHDMQKWVWDYNWAFMSCAPPRRSHNVPRLRKSALPHVEQGLLKVQLFGPGLDCRGRDWLGRFISSSNV